VVLIETALRAGSIRSWPRPLRGRRCGAESDRGAL